MPNIDEKLLDAIADALIEPGYIVLEQALPMPLAERLLSHFNNLDCSEFKRAGVGRQLDFQIQESIRSDHIHWLSDAGSQGGDEVKQFLGWMDRLRSGINRRLFLGLSDYESHFASYAAGAFYQKHRDAFSGQKTSQQANRVLSTVLYLNKDWDKSCGGELVLYAEDEVQVLAKVAPLYGRLLIFLSEKFPHEVLPATRQRKSIAGWFRVKPY